MISISFDMEPTIAVPALAPHPFDALETIFCPLLFLPEITTALLYSHGFMSFILYLAIKCDKSDRVSQIICQRSRRVYGRMSNCISSEDE